MDLSGNYTFDAPQAIVWEAIKDPNVLGSVMPGGEGFEQVGDNEYAGTLKVRVGPVQGKFDVTITLSDVVEPVSYSIDVDGKGGQGFVKANGGIKLEGQGDKTDMEYAGSAQISGRIASVGQRLIDSTARSIVRQSLDGLNEYLKVQVAQQPAEEAPTSEEPAAEAQEAAPEPAPVTETPAASTYKPPSQTEVAFNVAKDVAGDIVPEGMRPVAIAVGVGVVLLILFLLFR